MQLGAVLCLMSAVAMSALLGWLVISAFAWMRDADWLASLVEFAQHVI